MIEQLEERALLSVMDASLIVHTQGDNDDDDGTAMARGEDKKPPSQLVLDAPASVDEGGTITLNGSFVDPSREDTHTVFITWGDGSGGTTLGLPAGVTSFRTTHLYAQDLSLTRTNDFAIQATVTDDDSHSTNAVTRVMVNNVPPSNLLLNAPTSVQENATITLTGSFTDPGPQDTHRIAIQWSDGGSTTLNLDAGVTNFSAPHRYVDAGPAGSAASRFTIAVTVADSDFAIVTARRDIVVSNVAPSDLSVHAPAMVNENSPMTLTGTFADPGTDDTHTVDIYWGDGNHSTLNLDPGVTNLSATHSYLDDFPGSTAPANETIIVVVQDQGGAMDMATTSVMVVNVPPSYLSLHVADIDENGVAVLYGYFADPGTRDTHTVVVNWDDGSPALTLNLTAGLTAFTASHRYLDDDLGLGKPNGYAIKASVTDDDGGSTTATTNLTVNNVAPSHLMLHVPGSVSQNDPVSLTGSFVDAGTLDTHTAAVDWGDGNRTTLTLAAGVTTFNATHVYASESPSGGYSVQATVTDDGGASTTAGKSVTVTVNNVAPSNLMLSAPATAKQGDQVALAGAFTDSGPQDTHTVVVNWDDPAAPEDSGSTTLTLGAGVTTFTAMHPYMQTGTHHITVHVTDHAGASVDGSAAVDVSAAGIIGSGSLLTGHAYTPLTDAEVASFTYANGMADASAFPTTIGWGDGTSSAGTVIRQDDGSYVVQGTHTYQARGTFTVTVAVGDTGATITGTATIATELMPDGSIGTPTQQFVAEVYRALLVRQVDQGGLDFWSHFLDQGMSRTTMVSSLENVVSNEFRALEVQGLYLRYLSRAPEAAALNWGINFLHAGGTIEQLSSFLLSSEEYLGRSGGTSDGFVAAIYQNILGRGVDDSGRAFGLQMLSQGWSRQQLVMALFSSQEHCQGAVNSIFEKYLGRPADGAAMNLFASFMRQGIRQEEIIAALMGEMSMQEFAHVAA